MQNFREQFFRANFFVEFVCADLNAHSFNCERVAENLNFANEKFAKNIASFFERNVFA